MGLSANVAPIFTVAPLHWEAPHLSTLDCVLLTSANAARHAGAKLAAFTTLPCFAVGESSAEAARAAGFTDIRTADSDGTALLELAAKSGMERPLHLCGRDHLPLEHPHLSLTRRMVYASEAVAKLPEHAAQALRKGALVLLHSPRAGALFGELVDRAGLDRAVISIAALSKNIAGAAGQGWKAVASAVRPSDDALLELAAKLCQTSGSATGKSG